MRPPIVIETGALDDGSIVYRSNCPRCGVHGVWLKDLNVVERNAALHLRTVHADKAAA